MKRLFAFAALALASCTPAYAQNFQTDRVITPEEIEPAVTVLNDWNKKLYPSFALRYSSDPRATQAQGKIALNGSYRLIALFISKYVSTGAKPTLFIKGQDARPATTAYLFDQLRAASYAESGAFESLSMGNLNDTPGAVLTGLAESGARLPTGGSCPSCTAEYTRGRSEAKADVRRALDAIP